MSSDDLLRTQRAPCIRLESSLENIPTLGYLRRNNVAIMEWWIWIVLGLALLLGELVTPGGFYILFFGIGAIVVGALAGFDVAGPTWFQVVLFSIISVVTLWLFRERLLQATQKETPYNVDSMVGETAVMMEAIPSNGIGKAEMRGTSWNARNIGEKPLARGERCRVERVEGLTLLVRSEPS